NPAALAWLGRAGLSLMHAPIGFGDAAQSFAGLAYPTLRAGSFGVGLMRLSAGGIRAFDADSRPQGEIDYAEPALYPSYGAAPRPARNLARRGRVRPGGVVAARPAGLRLPVAIRSGDASGEPVGRVRRRRGRAARGPRGGTAVAAGGGRARAHACPGGGAGVERTGGVRAWRLRGGPRRVEAGGR